MLTALPRCSVLIPLPLDSRAPVAPWWDRWESGNPYPVVRRCKVPLPLPTENSS